MKIINLVATPPKTNFKWGNQRDLILIQISTKNNQAMKEFGCFETKKKKI